MSRVNAAKAAVCLAPFAVAAAVFVLAVLVYPALMR